MFRFILSAVGALLLIGAAGSSDLNRLSIGQSLIYVLIAFALFGIVYLISRKKASK